MVMKAAARVQLPSSFLKRRIRDEAVRVLNVHSQNLLVQMVIEEIDEITFGEMERRDLNQLWLLAELVSMIYGILSEEDAEVIEAFEQDVKNVIGAIERA